MLATLLTIGMLAQGPQAGGTPPPVANALALEVRGQAELDQAAAFSSARLAAEEHFQTAWADRADRLARAQQPFWLPDFLVAETVRRSLRDWDAAAAFRIVDRADKVREHEFGRSFQTTLWVAEDARARQAQENRLRHRLRSAERDLVTKLGATAGLWGLLAFLGFWIDRLSRGYMTGRLLLLGTALGCAVPTVLFLL